ncbi:MAG: DUF4159 domain-containing protein [Acidobacteria bacterium]|nr:DUF4159 domain-containing protein [Acidobacteriota bacterium]
MPRLLKRLTAVALVAVLVGSAAVSAQRFYGGRQRMAPRVPSGPVTHRLFTFARGQYQSTHNEQGGQGWYTDYPDADVNFTIRLSELTRTPVGFTPNTYPDHVVVQLTDPELFNYPFLFMSDVGTAYFNPDEADRLGAYLRKGGFLWVDDFWGPAAWDQWASEIGKALPPGEFPVVDIPITDPIHHGMFDVSEVPQVPSIQHFRRSGGRTTSERGQQSAVVHVRGIYNAHGRLMVLMTHNTDIADGWEREGEDYEFFYRYSITSYAVGINFILHAMSH